MKEISHSFLNSIIESSDDAIIGITLKGQIASWNQAAERIYGYSSQQIKDQPLWQLALPERHDEIQQLLRSVAQSKRISHFRTMHLRSDGQAIFVSLSLSPIFNPAGHCFGAALICRDITRQLHEEQTLQETQEKYRQIFRCESDAILLIDAKSRAIVEANEAALQLYRYTLDELIQLRFSDLSGEADAGKHDLVRCLSGNVDHIPATCHRRKDGDTFIADISISSILCSGRRLLVAIVRDVSERQRNQQLLQSLAMAREIQRKLLPQDSINLPHLDLYASTRYCDEIGGDFYDYFLPHAEHHSLGFAVGDVSGHGISAALLMAMVKGVFRSAIEQFDGDLEALFIALNRQLVHHSRDDNFMTFFYGLFNPDDHSLC
ncbi:MAG: PAS domain S-box protein [Desulfuromonas sp.]|nr:PAS domain S-box protein [Desulfuromonas sp.]